MPRAKFSREFKIQVVKQVLLCTDFSYSYSHYNLRFIFFVYHPLGAL